MYDCKPCHDPPAASAGRQGNESIPEQRGCNGNPVNPVALQSL